VEQFIIRNWLILAITSLLVALYIWIFDGFMQGKAYMFILLALVFGAVYIRKLKKGSK
jgi:hypothetical protein